jgi:glutathione S-transferase
MLERIATRRRLRRQRRVRDGLLLDLGALVYELHRQGKRAPELLQRKAAELGEVDDEVRALEAELAGEPYVAGEQQPAQSFDEDALGEEPRA